MTFHDNSSKIFCKVMPNADPSKKFRPWKSILCISIATEQITVQKIPKKLLSKSPAEFGFFCPDAYAVPGVRGTPLPLFLISASPGAGPGAWAYFVGYWAKLDLF